MIDYQATRVDEAAKRCLVILQQWADMLENLRSQLEEAAESQVEFAKEIHDLVENTK